LIELGRWDMVRNEGGKKDTCCAAAERAKK
jgi:hypothetical protein